MQKQIEVQFCDYCYTEHNKLHRTLENFDYTKKFSMTECVGCWSCMCLDCIETSKKYLQNSVVQSYDMSLCAECILKKWSDMEYRTFVLDTIHQHEKYMRISLKKTILSWNKIPWNLPIWANSTSTSHLSQRKNAPKVLSKDIGVGYASSSSSLVISQSKK
jgi:hypothetical protein